MQATFQLPFALANWDVLKVGNCCAGGGIATGHAPHHDARAQGGSLAAAVAARARCPHRHLRHLQGEIVYNIRAHF